MIIDWSKLADVGSVNLNCSLIEMEKWTIPTPFTAEGKSAAPKPHSGGGTGNDIIEITGMKGSVWENTLFEIVDYPEDGDMALSAIRFVDNRVTSIHCVNFDTVGELLESLQRWMIRGPMAMWLEFAVKEMS